MVFFNLPFPLQLHPDIPNCCGNSEQHHNSQESSYKLRCVHEVILQTSFIYPSVCHNTEVTLSFPGSGSSSVPSSPPAAAHGYWKVNVSLPWALSRRRTRGCDSWAPAGPAASLPPSLPPDCSTEQLCPAGPLGASTRTWHPSRQVAHRILLCSLRGLLAAQKGSQNWSGDSTANLGCTEAKYQNGCLNYKSLHCDSTSSRVSINQQSRALSSAMKYNRLILYVTWICAHLFSQTAWNMAITVQAITTSPNS